MKIAMMLFAATLAVQPVMAQLQWSALDGLAAKAKESVEITLDPATMQMAAGLIGGGNKTSNHPDQVALSQVLTQLRSITVRTYEFKNVGEYDMNLVRRFADQLSRQSWSRIVAMKDGDASFELYSKTDQGKSAGFALIAAEPKELAVIHIDGAINLADLAQLGGKFGIPNLPLSGADSGKGKSKGKNKAEKGKE